MGNAGVGILFKNDFWHIPQGYAFSFLYLLISKEGGINMEKTKNMTEVALSIALAVICSFIKVWEMPQGGSVSLTMVPLFIIAFRRGPVSGIAAGGIYGLISAMLSGVLYHPMSLLLDYLLAYSVIGIAGFFKKSVKGVICGTIAGTIGRFLFSLISGAVLFAEYAPEGQNPWIYSLIYQATYMIPELIICLAVMIVIAMNNKRKLI